MPDALSVIVDTAQRRLVRGRLGLTAEKTGFAGSDFSNTWGCPVDGTLMLQPPPVSETWDTTDTGIYTRLSLTDFGLTFSPSGWKTVDNRSAGPVRLYRETQMGGSSVQTTASYGVNRGWYVSFYTYNIENETSGVYFECGWDSGGTGAVGVSLQFRTDGSVLIQKDGVIVGGGSIGVQGGANNSNNYANYLIIPMRRRDLLIYSLTSGDGFIHTFEDIAEDAVNPVILADEPFWWYMPTNSVNVELAVLQFPTSGYVTSLPIALSDPPGIGEALETRANGVIAPAVTNAYVLGDQPERGAADTTNVISAVSVRNLDGSAFTPDGTTKEVILRCNFTGDGSYTPFLYAAHAAYGAQFEDTDDAEEFDITPYIIKASTPHLSVSDDAGGTEFTFEILSPETVESADVAKLLTLGNRPCQVRIGANVLIDGVLDEPQFIDALYDDAARLRCTVRDYLAIAQQVQFRERVPLDGVALCEIQDGSDYWNSAVQFIAYQAGIDNANMDLDAVGFTIPTRPTNEIDTAFQTLVEIGSTPYEELARFVGTYCAGFFWGMVPQPSAAPPKLTFYDPDNLSGTPDYTLYRDEVAALADGGLATDLYYSYTDSPLSIEANEVRCTGFDPRLQRAVSAYKVDTASQDPTTAPSARPDNWVGLPRVFGVIDPRFNSLDACTRAVEAIYPRVTARYWVSTFTSEMLFKTDGAPVWRGSLVDLDGRRQVRISALSVDFLVEDSAEIVVRRAVYTGGTILNRGGSNVAEIRAASNMAAIGKTFVYRGGDIIARATPVSAELVP